MRHYVNGFLFGGAISFAYNAARSLQDGIPAAALLFAMLGLYCAMGLAVSALRQPGPRGAKGDTGPMGEPGRCDCSQNKLRATSDCKCGKQVLLG